MNAVDMFVVWTRMSVVDGSSSGRGRCGDPLRGHLVRVKRA